MPSNILFPCGICRKNVITNAIECSLCKQWIHLKCNNLKKNDLVKLEGSEIWQCKNCVSLLLFSDVENCELLYWCNESYADIDLPVYSRLIAKCQDINTGVYENVFSNFNDIDNMYCTSHLATRSNYFTTDQFKSNFKSQNGLSIFSLNARSLKKNIDNINQLLDNLSFNFDIIAVTENWLDRQELDCVNIDGYQVTHIVREAKKGGGCSIFVNNLVNYKVVKNLCFNVNDEIECACVELDMGKEKNVTRGSLAKKR